jgi:hypothetical protein
MNTLQDTLAILFIYWIVYGIFLTIASVPVGIAYWRGHRNTIAIGVLVYTTLVLLCLMPILFWLFWFVWVGATTWAVLAKSDERKEANHV